MRPTVGLIPRAVWFAGFRIEPDVSVPAQKLAVVPMPELEAPVASAGRPSFVRSPVAFERHGAASSRHVGRVDGVLERDEDPVQRAAHLAGGALAVPRRAGGLVPVHSLLHGPGPGTNVHVP